MLTFFRKLRHRLISENRFTKYLLYAIGEIVLIVIGILIALSINNWNQERNDREKEILILGEMLKELESDHTHLGSKLETSDDKAIATQFLLDFIDQEKSYHDSLNHIFSKTPGWTTFFPSISSFETLNYTGLSLVSDNLLRLNILSLYNGTYKHIPGMEEWRSNFHFHEVAPFESTSFKEFDWFGESIPLNGQKLLNNDEYYYILKMQNNMAKQEIRVYNNAITEIEELKDLISRHINKI